MARFETHPRLGATGFRIGALSAFALVLFFATGLCAQPETPLSPEALAAAYYDQGDFDKASEEYEALYEKNPQPLYFERLWKCSVEMGEFKKAEKLVRKHLKTPGGQTVPNRIKLGLTLGMQGDSKKAEEVYESLLSEIDQQPALVYSMAKAFEDVRLYRKAVEAYERAEKTNPGFQFHYQKAQLYGELGEVERVYDEFMELIALNPAYLANVQAMLAQSIGSDPEDEANVMLKKKLLERMQKDDAPMYSDLLVWVFIQETDFDGAFRQLRALDQRYDRGQFELLELGKTAQRLGEFEAAMRCFQYIATECKPPSNQAPQAQVELLETRRLSYERTPESADWSGLSADYASLIAREGLQPNTYEAARQRAEILAFRLGDTTLALDELEALIERSGESNQAAWLSYGDVLAFSGSSASALLAYARVEKSAEGSELADQAKFNRAKLAFREGDFEWATHLFDALKTSTSKAISNDAIDYSVLIRSNTDADSSTEALRLYAKADAFFFRNMPAEAIATLDRLEFAFPDHELADESLWLRSRIAWQRGMVDETLSCLDRLLREQSESIWADDALFEFGLIQITKKGNVEAANKAFLDLLEKHPDSFYTDAARRELRKIRGEELL